MTLLTQHFQVTLVQDVIFNATAATLGGQTGLDYLPGSVFLGALASKMYSELSADDAWSLFHSGAFRFMDALPLVQQQPTWPMPISWHHFKGETVTTLDKRLHAAKVFDPALPNASQETNRQPKQMRTGYVSAAGHWVKPNLSQRMKTAIDQDTGRAAEGQLFGYQSLDAGQVYYFEIQAPMAHKNLFDRAVKQLSGSLRLGRSRTAQYGQVDIKPVNAFNTRPQSLQDKKQLTLWLLSDLALTDETGKPCLQPKPEFLGLPEGSIWHADQSFIRTRTYSPFNAHRRCYDLERQVISRGSVLRFTLSQSLSDKHISQLQNIGRFQEQGLGKIAINPKLLSTASPTFEVLATPVKTVNTKTLSEKQVEHSVLVTILQSRVAEQNFGKEAERFAQEIFDELIAALISARNWLGITQNQPLPLAPGRSQWGKIKELASQHRHKSEMLWQQLVSNNDAAIRERSGWELEINPNEKLYQVLVGNPNNNQHGLLHKVKDHKYFAEIIGRLAVLGLTNEWQHAVSGTSSSAKEVL
ncbi:MAG: hypothetical protein NWQ54_23760 [Paraglaciecola sp.]|nr:hypothetical protein [Paraglaciecola sp.]